MLLNRTSAVPIEQIERSKNKVVVVRHKLLKRLYVGEDIEMGCCRVCRNIDISCTDEEIKEGVVRFKKRMKRYLR